MRLTERSPSPAFVISKTGDVEAHSAELAALAIASGQEAVRLPDGSVAVSRRVAADLRDISAAEAFVPAPKRLECRGSTLWGKLYSHLSNAELLSWQAWTRDPAQSLLRLIPLSVKERINHKAGRPLFDLSFYLQFQPRSVLLKHVPREPLRYVPAAHSDRSRAAIIIPHFGVGGAESVLLDMISALDRSRFEILVLATQSRDDRWRGRWMQKADHTYDLARVVPPERMTDAVRSIVSNWKCDLVVVQNTLYGYAALPLIKGDLPGTKVIDIIHALDHHWDPVACTAGVAPFVDLHVAMSPDVYRRFLATGEPPAKARLLPAGVDLTQFHPSASREASIKQILFAARLDPVKRPLLLVDIAAQLRILRKTPDFRFVIAGDGPEMSRFQAAVRRRNLETIFDFRGQVEDLAPLYAACDVVLLVSKSEGVPLVIIEAMACALPVVASNVGGVPELLGSCGLAIDVAPGEVQAFAEALDGLLSQPQQREKLGSEGRKVIAATRDLRVVTASYAALFQDAMQSRMR